jgi:acetyltransferase-like isoleucine patch superfamily enzyme
MNDNSDIDLLKEKIISLWEKLRNEYKSKFDRDLPFDELLSDRWNRAKELGFGENTSIYLNSYVYGNVSVGKNTWIGPFTILEGTGGLTIGDNCSISAGVQIYTHNSVKWAVSNGKENYEHQPVSIGNCCFIGPNSIIKNGISVGEHSIVAAGSFVNKNVVPYSIVAGNPAKLIGKVILSDDNKVTLDYLKK